MCYFVCFAIWWTVGLYGIPPLKKDTVTVVVEVIDSGLLVALSRRRDAHCCVDQFLPDQGSSLIS